MIKKLGTAITVGLAVAGAVILWVGWAAWMTVLPALGLLYVAGWLK